MISLCFLFFFLKSFLVRALKIVTKKFGSEHPQTAEVLYAIGNVHSVEHDYDKVSEKTNKTQKKHTKKNVTFFAFLLTFSNENTKKEIKERAKQRKAEHIFFRKRRKRAKRKV